MAIPQMGAGYNGLARISEINTGNCMNEESVQRRNLFNLNTPKYLLDPSFNSTISIFPQLGTAADPITNTFFVNVGTAAVPVTNAFFTTIGSVSVPVVDFYVTNIHWSSGAAPAYIGKYDATVAQRNESTNVLTSGTFSTWEIDGSGNLTDSGNNVTAWNYTGEVESTPFLIAVKEWETSRIVAFHPGHASCNKDDVPDYLIDQCNNTTTETAFDAGDGTSTALQTITVYVENENTPSSDQKLQWYFLNPKYDTITGDTGTDDADSTGDNLRIEGGGGSVTFNSGGSSLSFSTTVTSPGASTTLCEISGTLNIDPADASGGTEWKTFTFAYDDPSIAVAATTVTFNLGYTRPTGGMILQGHFLLNTLFDDGAAVEVTASLGAGAPDSDTTFYIAADGIGGASVVAGVLGYLTNQAGTLHAIDHSHPLTLTITTDGANLDTLTQGSLTVRLLVSEPP